MATRLLTVNLETKYYPESVPRRSITCQGSSIDLTDEEYDALVSELPPFWHNENDKLLRFIVFSNKEHFCEREKKFFNYTLRTEEIKVYRFDGASKEEGEALYAFFVEKFTKIQVSRIENLYDEIMSNIKDMSFVKYSLLNARDDLLAKSDHLMLPDYPISEEDRAKWVEYRQKLRDLTDQLAWQENNLMDIEMPVSPAPLDQISILKSNISDLSSIPENLTDIVIDTLVDKPIEEIIKNVTQTTLKFELLKSISKLNLPFLTMGYSELTGEQSSYESFMDQILNNLVEQNELPTDWWSTATSSIDEKIQQVNEKLKSYNIDFTINDILNAILEQSRANLEIDDIIEDL
jgi:hypothetical protein